MYSSANARDEEVLHCRANQRRRILKLARPYLLLNQFLRLRIQQHIHGYSPPHAARSAYGSTHPSITLSIANRAPKILAAIEDDCHLAPFFLACLAARTSSTKRSTSSSV